MFCSTHELMMFSMVAEARRKEGWLGRFVRACLGRGARCGEYIPHGTGACVARPESACTISGGDATGAFRCFLSSYPFHLWPINKLKACGLFLLFSERSCGFVDVLRLRDP